MGAAPDHDYLKYWRVIKYFAKRKYQVSSAYLDMLLFLYSEKYFNKTTFKEYGQLLSWDANRFYRLIKQGYIQKWREKTGRQATLYQLTYKAKRMINSVYKKLNGEEIPEYTNPMFRHDATYMQKVTKKFIKKLNKSIKQQQHLSHL